MTQHLEVEHKYVIGAEFDLDSWRQKARSLSPRRHKTLTVEDHYFYSTSFANRVFRYRCDAEIQQLTLKSLGKGNEVRTEINLNLRSDLQQSEQVSAFLGHIGIASLGKITKKIEVFEFDDLELVYYHASTERQSVACIELEATRYESVEEALSIVQSYEALFGFKSSDRELKSLPELLKLWS